MILGLGIDLCAVSRMRENLKNGRFLDRYFADEEKAYILGRGQGAAESAAACFAAKEAFLKALGTGLGGADLREIALLHDESGAPYFSLRGSAKLKAELWGAQQVFVSLSHDNGTAAAVVLLEG